MWIGVPVKAEEVKVWFSWNTAYAVRSFIVFCKGKTRSISILIRVKQYVRAVIFVIAGKSASCEETVLLNSLSSTPVRLQLQYIGTSASLQVECPHFQSDLVQYK